MSPQVKLTSRELAIVTAGVAGSGRCTLGTNTRRAGAERDGGRVDARSPPPGAATERTELWLEGNSYSPLPSRLRPHTSVIVGSVPIARTLAARSSATSALSLILTMTSANDESPLSTLTPNAVSSE